MKSSKKSIDKEVVEQCSFCRITYHGPWREQTFSKTMVRAVKYIKQIICGLFKLQQKGKGKKKKRDFTLYSNMGLFWVPLLLFGCEYSEKFLNQLDKPR